MPGIDGSRERIAQFWRAIELFSPPSLRKPDARGHVEDFYPGEPMPWEPGSQLASTPAAPGKVWRHEVFAGVYDIQRVTARPSAPATSGCAATGYRPRAPARHRNPRS